MGELRHIETTLHSLESKLSGVRRYLPKPSRKRGLLNLGGSILRFLFGAATDIDLEQLHVAIHNLNDKQDHVAHALDQQMTYFKRMDDTINFNYHAVVNLSSVLRNHAIKTQETFQEIKSKLDWSEKQRRAVLNPSHITLFLSVEVCTTRV
jgi:hypothetical protein